MVELESLISEIMHCIEDCCQDAREDDKSSLAALLNLNQRVRAVVLNHLALTIKRCDLAIDHEVICSANIERELNRLNGVENGSNANC